MNAAVRTAVALLLGTALSAGGIAAVGAEPMAGGSALIEGVPHVKQKPDFCGEACAEMYLRKLGSRIDQDEVFDRSAVPPAYGRGCYTPELKRSLEEIGFKVGDVWTRIDAARPAKHLARNWKALHDDLLKGFPSIVCTRYSDRPNTTEHFRLVLGYDAEKDEVIYHEPAEEKGAYRRMKREAFLGLWPLKYHQERWTLVRLRLEPGKLASARAAAGPTDADYAQHVMELKKRLRSKLPGKVFHIAVQKPFVVVGDEDADTVRGRSVRTVKWASDMLKADYFPKDPNGTYDVFLFKDRESYTTGARALFGDRPSTPFGYCSSRNKALVMNIATGGGTLVHEMVHSFMGSNFPACPSWFNEGLASLYEQCGAKNGKIHGYTNWRLAGLQKAISEKRVPEFKELCSTTTHQFYNRDKGTNYAQARYLCYYLQEHGLLRKYYAEFRKNAAADPTGYETLKKTLSVKSDENMKKFKKDWENWVLKLRFR